MGGRAKTIDRLQAFYFCPPLVLHFALVLGFAQNAVFASHAGYYTQALILIVNPWINPMDFCGGFWYAYVSLAQFVLTVIGSLAPTWTHCWHENDIVCCYWRAPELHSITHPCERNLGIRGCPAHVHCESIMHSLLIWSVLYVVSMWMCYKYLNGVV